MIRFVPSRWRPRVMRAIVAAVDEQLQFEVERLGEDLVRLATPPKAPVIIRPRGYAGDQRARAVYARALRRIEQDGITPPRDLLRTVEGVVLGRHR